MSKITTEIDRGSEWNKWDLHLHSPETKKNNQYKLPTGDALDIFCEKLETSDVSVFGITDYFSADGYLSFIKAFKLKYPESEKVFFPNIELCTSDVVNSATEEVNLHVIFNPSLPDLEQKLTSFLHYLSTNKTKNSKQVKASELKNTKDFEEATTTRTFILEALTEVFGDKQNISESVLIVAAANNDGIRSERGKKRKSVITDEVDKFCDGFFGNSNNTNHFLNTDRLEDNEKIDSKPVFAGSDAHSFDDFDNWCGKFIHIDAFLKETTWIKADKTFEGLRQVLYEPGDRIRIQERNPCEGKTERVVIDKATYKDGYGKERVIYFNKDLNSIIGVRGSGKSTLLKNLAQKTDIDQFKEKDKKPLYQLTDFEVTWGDGQKNAGTSQSPKSVFYIPQGYLSALAYDDGDYITQRDEFLTKLLKKNIRFANAVQSFETFVSKNKIKIEEIIEKLLTADTAVKETEQLFKKQGSRTEIDSEIKKKNAQIKKYKEDTGSSVTDKEISDYSFAQKAITDSARAIDILKQDKTILASLKKSGANIFISNNEFSLLSAERQELIQNELSKESGENLKSLISKEIIKIESQIQGHTKIITEQTKIFKVLEEKIKKSKALEDLTKELGILQLTLTKINELSEKLIKSKKERLESITSLAEAYMDFDLQQDTIYKTIRFDENFSFLKIEVVARYNLQQIKYFVERNINTRDSSVGVKSKDNIKTLFSDSPVQLKKDAIEDIITGLIEGDIRIKVEVGDISTVLSQLLRNRFEIDYLNSVKTKDGGTNFKEMTGGQKAIALLELVFRFDDEKYPILIDQPEDDLDVVGIATDLVNFVRTEKDERQIILVTHNASLVVCSDSENIISSQLSRTDKGKHNFSYAVGAIENEDRRNDIVQILEGGDDALRRRMRKLNISKLK